MKRVLDSVAKVGAGIHPSSYGDNIIIVVDDIRLKQSAIDALTEAVKRNFDPAVLPELTRRIKTSKPSQKFMFCQRWYQRKKDGLVISADVIQVENFGIRVALDVADARRDRDIENWKKSIEG